MEHVKEQAVALEDCAANCHDADKAVARQQAINNEQADLRDLMRRAQERHDQLEAEEIELVSQVGYRTKKSHSLVILARQLNDMFRGRISLRRKEEKGSAA